MSHLVGNRHFEFKDHEAVTLSLSSQTLSSESETALKLPVEEHNFISFLTLAQAFDHNFLAYTWQPALGPIGRGYTAAIRQAIASLQATFAFKVFDRHRPRYSVFEELITEITVLGNYSIRTHPNILPLQGICWDVLHDGTVLPVLVTEKTTFGNLAEFFGSNLEAARSIDLRLYLCTGLLAAIIELHAVSLLSA